MAAEGGRDPASLKELLFEEPGRFEFFQAVRLLQRMWPERRPVGEEGDPGEEVVRLRSDVSLAFPTSDIRRLEPSRDGRPAELTASFLGVATPASFGSLPRRYAEEVRRLARDRNPALRDFLDILNHRFLSLFYRAFERYRLALLWERGRDNPFERALRAVLGLGTPGLAQRLPVEDRALFPRAGLLAMRPVPASALESLVRSVFGVPARIEPFVPAWYAIEEVDRNRLGLANATLGEDLYVGEWVRLIQAKFRIRLGPLSREQFESLLPDRPRFRALVKIVRLAVGAELDFELRLVIGAEECPRLELLPSPAVGCRLGWSSWLGVVEGPDTVGDALFDPEAGAGRASEGELREEAA